MKLVIILATVLVSLTAKAGGGGGGGYETLTFEPLFVAANYQVENVTDQYQQDDEDVIRARKFTGHGVQFTMVEYWGNDRGTTVVGELSESELYFVFGTIEMVCRNEDRGIYCDSEKVRRSFWHSEDGWFVIAPGKYKR